MIVYSHFLKEIFFLDLATIMYYNAFKASTFRGKGALGSQLIISLSLLEENDR